MAQIGQRVLARWFAPFGVSLCEDVAYVSLCDGGLYILHSGSAKNEESVLIFTGKLKNKAH